jgi:hypothetical protein
MEVTAWWKFGERMLLRETYQHFNISSNDTVSIRFVLGLPPKEDPGILHFLQWEQERFEDLQILNMHKNMNSGKSYKGSCFCGAVQFTVSGEPAVFAGGDRPRGCRVLGREAGRAGRERSE